MAQKAFPLVFGFVPYFQSLQKTLVILFLAVLYVVRRARVVAHEVLSLPE